MGVEDHRKRARRAVRTAVLTVSDTRTEADDAGGRLIREMLREAGHPLAGHEIIREDPEQIRRRFEHWIGSGPVEAILITGGTGIGRRDATVEVLRPLLEKTLEGFGELFRSLSFQEIGAAAMLSRALGGVAGGKVVLAIPGSEPAVRLAMTRLILPELPHLAWLVNPDPPAGGPQGA